MQGTVKVATGAVLPGAKIAITPLATARVTNTIGDNEGCYASPARTRFAWN